MIQKIKSAQIFTLWPTQKKNTALVRKYCQSLKEGALTFALGFHFLCLFSSSKKACK
jgi:hypothetical protein